MSGARVCQEALRLLLRLRLPREAMDGLVAALDAGRPTRTADVLYRAGAEAGLGQDELLARAAALYLGWCGGNLCDDLIDGECTYLAPAHRVGPAVQIALQHACFGGLLATTVERGVLAAAMGELVRVSADAVVEVRTERWDAARYRLLADGTGGRQWATWLRLLWAGTALAAQAETVGRSAAVLGYVVADARSADPRFVTLTREERRAIVAWARAAADALAATGLATARDVLAGTEPALRALEDSPDASLSAA